MVVSWQRVETPSTGSSRAENDPVGGAVACVVGKRVYLVGGSGTKINDPDIALSCLTWSSPFSHGEGQHKEVISHSCNKKDTATEGNHAVAPMVTVARTACAGPMGAPVLVSTSGCQKGDVPTARIGHAAITFSEWPSSSLGATSPTSIIVFGGESCTLSKAHGQNGSEALLYSKLADAYEGIPTSPSGALVWRELSVAEPGVDHDVPAPMAFHAFCAASVRASCDTDGNPEQALLVHGGINQSAELLADLWAFFPARVSKVATKGEAGLEGGDGASSDDDKTTGWERLQPQGEGPPPSAYHSATPLCAGATIVFIGGGKSWRTSAIFLLDAVRLNWSSFDVIGGIGQRCLHSAVPVRGFGIDGGIDTAMQQRMVGDAIKTRTTESEKRESAPAPTVQLWDPLVSPEGGGPAAPVSAPSTSSGKGVAAVAASGVAAAGAKKKASAKDGAAAQRKTGSKEVTNQRRSSRNGVDSPAREQVDGGAPDAEGGGPPAFESILIFGGIANETVVSGDAMVLRHDGIVSPLPIVGKQRTSPGPRFSHAMVPVPAVDNGCGNTGGCGGSSTQLLLLFGGCHGDGTRVAKDEVFVLDLAGGEGAGATSDGGGGGRGGTDDKESGEGVKAEDTQTKPAVILANGDVYTGERDEDGRRQGKGRCEYGAALKTAEGEITAAGESRSGSGGGSGGSYTGDWDEGEPHGHGERIYEAPQARGGANGTGVTLGGGGAAGGTTQGNDEDMAIVLAAFGPRCPPIATYRGQFKRGVRAGKGTCSFVAPGSAAAAAAAAAGRAFASSVGCGVRGGGGALPATSSLSIPESYAGEWVGGRPLGRGVLSLRAAPLTASSGLTYSSSVAGSGSNVISGETGSIGNGGGGGCSRSNSSGGSDGWVEGVWTEEGLIYGKEKLPGKGGVYEGQFRHGTREGHGKLDLPDGSEYEGVCRYASGSRYEGLWLDGLRHGEGVLYPPPGGGNSLAGLWHRNEFKLAAAAAASTVDERTRAERELQPARAGS